MIDLRVGMNQQIQREIEVVAQNWFRDIDGNDRTKCEGISIGLSLYPTVKIGLTSVINYYSKFHEITNAIEQIQLPSKPTRLQIEIAQKFGCRIEELRSNKSIAYDEFVPRVWQIPDKRISKWIRLLQEKMPNHLLKGKNIFIADFTTTKYADNQTNTLRLFRKSLIRGAFTQLDKDCLRKYESAYPNLLDKSSELSNIERVLNQFKIVWPVEMIELCATYISTVYVESRETIVKCCAIWSDLIEFYKPRIVSLPADNFFDTIVLFQLCHKNSIQTKMYSDGYNCLPIFPPLKSVDGTDWLATTVVAYGLADQKRLAALGIPQNRIETINPPFLNNFAKREHAQIFDFIICTLLPCVINPQTDYLSPPTSLKEILRCLIDMGYTNIAVKVKVPEETEYVQEVMNELGINLKILYGKMRDHIFKTKAVVGGISTTLVEAEYVGIPYYVYEPVENGYLDEWFDKSFVVSRETIARNPDELRVLISGGIRSLQAPYTDLVDGSMIS
jgi:hypothetical protein